MLHAWKNIILGPDGTMISFQSVVPDDMGGFTVPGGTCLKKIPVVPLTPEEMEAEYEWSRRAKMDVARLDGEAFQDFQARKRGLMLLRDQESLL